MEKLLVILKREYLTRVRNKAYILTTLLTPLFMGAITFVPSMLLRDSRMDFRLVVLDQTGDAGLYERAQALMTEDNAKRDRYRVSREAVGSEGELRERQQQLGQQLSAGQLDAYVVVPPQLAEVSATPPKLVCYTKNIQTFLSAERIEEAFNRAVLERRMAAAGIAAAQAGAFTQRIEMERGNERGEKEDKSLAGFLAPFMLIMLLVMTIMFSGVQIMQGIIEEKESRVIEVILSSSSAFDVMMGKLLGIGLVGLTQVFVWLLMALVLVATTLLPGMALLPKSISWSWYVPVFFVVYFLLGYFLFAALYVIIGAVCSRNEDAQNMQLPISLLIVMPAMLMFIVTRDAQGMLATVLSIFPFFAPTLMLARIAAQTPPWWQIALSLVLLVVTVIAEVWCAAKIYRAGVLMYGKPPTLPELWRWLKYS